MTRGWILSQAGSDVLEKLKFTNGMKSLFIEIREHEL